MNIGDQVMLDLEHEEIVKSYNVSTMEQYRGEVAKVVNTRGAHVHVEFADGYNLIGPAECFRPVVRA